MGCAFKASRYAIKVGATIISHFCIQLPHPGNVGSPLQDVVINPSAVLAHGLKRWNLRRALDNVVYQRTNLNSNNNVSHRIQYRITLPNRCLDFGLSRELKSKVFLQRKIAKLYKIWWYEGFLRERFCLRKINGHMYIYNLRAVYRIFFKSIQIKRKACCKIQNQSDK